MRRHGQNLQLLCDHEIPVADRNRCLRRRSIAALAIVLGIYGAVSLSAQEAPDAAAQIQANNNNAAQGADANEPKPIIVKRIPDQKAYYLKSPDTIPDTILDLSETFAGTEIGAAELLEYKILLNSKKEVVDATLEGKHLTLKWGEIGKSELTIRVTNRKTREILDNKLIVQVWKADYWKLAFFAVGGLGIFLLGMKNMSEGLQAVAGSSLRRMISLATNNRLLATGMGVLVTMLVQSSSITTVMVVGFVNSGFMTLSQAIGVIMGANIGTTITGWILVLKIGKFGLPILGIGAFAYLFSKSDRIRYMAMIFMGLGMIFFGLELMKDGFATIKDLPDFEAWFHMFQADSYVGVLKCALVGCLLTFAVQSSSATLGITIGLAVTGVIEFDTAAALVMGENLGTTITAWLASRGATSNAKRAAYFHVIFNLVGVAWITAIFLQLYLPLIKSIVRVDVAGNPLDVTAAIATTHTLFNVTNTLLFLPLAGYFATLLERIVPERAIKEKPHLTSLDVRMLETPVIAIEQSRVEILRMADGCNKMMGWLETSLAEEEEPDHAVVQKVFHREEVLDTIQDEVVDFMTHLLSGNVPHTIIDEGRRQLRMADEYESISDYLTSILKFHLKLHNQGHRFHEKQREEMLELHKMVTDYVAMITRSYSLRYPEIITKANSLGDGISHRVKELRDAHLAGLSQEKIEPYVNLAYTAMLNSYQRVRDHGLNIAEALAGEK